VVAVDQRGHGRSDAPESSYDMDTAVGDLLALVEALALPRPVLAGQSWGGNVVLELGWRRPDAVRGIACVDGGIIELVDSYPSWEACLAALTPPLLDHLTRAELEGRMRASSPELPDRAIAAALECFRVREDGRVEPRLARHRHSRSEVAVGACLDALGRSGRPPCSRWPIRATSAHAAKRRAEARARRRPRLLHWFSPAPTTSTRGSGPGGRLLAAAPASFSRDGPRLLVVMARARRRRPW
jgi:pimeloyl-ACP methyl ester carboxylesterase